MVFGVFNNKNGKLHTINFHFFRNRTNRQWQEYEMAKTFNYQDISGEILDFDSIWAQIFWKIIEIVFRFLQNLNQWNKIFRSATM